MIVLDTNVLSELIRPSPDAQVRNWLGAQPQAALFTTAVSRSEMLYGVHVLPEGARKLRLLLEVRAVFAVDMAGRVLDFDSDAADAYAEIAAARRADGKPISQFDAMIAGIARSRGAELATRNVRDFEGCGIVVIDPWHS
jgi:toxin FitB